MGKRVLSSTDITKTLNNIARAILKDNLFPLALIGIQTRGVPLAERLRQELAHLTKKEIPLGTLDITLYRDDLATVGPAPIVKGTDIKFDITDKNLILVDDVLFSGRTIRAALDELMDLGRPLSIKLAVLVDRVDKRELPIQADFIGKKLVTKYHEIVEVKLQETDGQDEVTIK